MSEDDVLWWSHGGILRGESHKRFHLLHQIMEETPGIGLAPYDRCGWDEVCAVPENEKWGAVKSYYLYYYVEHDSRGSRHLQRKIPHRAAGETVYGGADTEGSTGVSWQWTHLEKNVYNRMEHLEKRCKESNWKCTNKNIQK